jgi:hypothetical protein
MEVKFDVNVQVYEKQRVASKHHRNNFLTMPGVRYIIRLTPQAPKQGDRFERHTPASPIRGI